MTARSERSVTASASDPASASGVAPGSGLSRRAVIGTAWAAPVVALAVSAPAAAASGAISISLTPFILSPTVYGFSVILKEGAAGVAGVSVSVDVQQTSGWEFTTTAVTDGSGTAVGTVPGDVVSGSLRRLRARAAVDSVEYTSDAVQVPRPSALLTAESSGSDVVFTVEVQGVSEGLAGLKVFLGQIQASGASSPWQEGYTDAAGRWVFTSPRADIPELAVEFSAIVVVIGVSGTFSNVVPLPPV